MKIARIAYNKAAAELIVHMTLMVFMGLF